MDYAVSVIRNLLFEEVAQNFVVYAIKKRHEVSFKYDSNDGDPRGKLERITVQPVAFGTTKAGNPCFRAYQINGSSESAEKNEGAVPGWRLFLLDRVVANTWKDSGRVFSEPPMYNPNGDKTMETVLVKADFKGSSDRYSRGGLKKYNTARHKQNVEKNPFYDFEKQLKRKEMAPDFVLKNIQNTQVSPAERQKQWDRAVAQNKGNQQSISDMSRQKDFGDDKQTETVGPFRKADASNKNVSGQKTSTNYSTAKQNGPMFKTNKNDNGEENLNNNEYQQRDSESPEADA